MSPVLMIAGALAAGAVALLLVGLIVQLLWNTTVPDLFDLRELGYWEAVRLLLLTSLLFSGFSMGLGL